MTYDDRIQIRIMIGQASNLAQNEILKQYDYYLSLTEDKRKEYFKDETRKYYAWLKELHEEINT